MIYLSSVLLSFFFNNVLPFQVNICWCTLFIHINSGSNPPLHSVTWKFYNLHKYFLQCGQIHLQFRQIHLQFRQIHLAMWIKPASVHCTVRLLLIHPSAALATHFNIPPKYFSTSNFSPHQNISPLKYVCT